MKQNCWEVKGCGRNPGGKRAAELGICPATTTTTVNGVNSGLNGGRSCWAIAGTLCGGKVQGIAALKMENCMKCDFFTDVWKEEKTAGTYTTSAEVIRALHLAKKK